MNTWTRWLLVGFLTVVGIPTAPASPARAQDPPSATTVSVTTIAVPAPDGAELATDVYLPPGDGPFPTLLIRTPYGREYRENTGRWFAEAGYAVVAQDVRGSGGSTGAFVPIVNEERDGVTTLEWLVDRPWSDGRVVLWGPSYLGHCAWVLAATGHPSIVAMAENAAWADNRTLLYRDGAFRLLAHLPWFLSFGSGRAVAEEEWPGMFRSVPLARFFEPMAGLIEGLIGRRFDYSKVRVPVLHLAGFHDYLYPSTLESYEAIERASDDAVPQRLVLGPWWHNQIWMDSTTAGDEDFGPEARYGFERVMETLRDWFDRHLGRDAGPGHPAVEVFVMGENRWRAFDAWPPPETASEEWYLGGDGTAEDPAGGGTLGLDRPGREGRDGYVYDPEDPVPTLGGATSHFFPALIGVRDRRAIETRPDVLVYTSAPLAETVDLIGPVGAVVHAATDGTDTDFTAQLVVVRPDGYARIVTGGIVRGRFRDGMDAPAPLEPGETYAFEIDMGAVALRVPAGSRLRVEVSSSDFPNYDRNPNTGEDAMYATEFRAATQTVRHGPDHPSRIVLPVWRGAGGAGR